MDKAVQKTNAALLKLTISDALHCSSISQVGQYVSPNGIHVTYRDLSITPYVLTGLDDFQLLDARDIIIRIRPHQISLRPLLLCHPCTVVSMYAEIPHRVNALMQAPESK